MNFSIFYSSKAGSAVINSVSAYFTNLNGALGFDSTGVTEVNYATMMANPTATLTGLSSTSWGLVANSYPQLVLKQNKVYSDSIIQP
jgi:hypothetical protein